MRGARQRDDGWDEGRRDSWQNGSGYQPDTAAGYQGTGYPNSAGYASQDSYASQAGYGGYAQSGYAAAPASGQYGWASPSAGSEFLPANESASGNDNAMGTPRPYGRLSIFTLLDDKAVEFDRLAERAAEGVRTAEPDTLVYVIHVVPKAPMQRIIYEIYRDRAAFESHEQQPHIQLFVADRRSCVLATNIIDLRLKYAKVAALASAQAPGTSAAAAPGFGQETQLDRVPAGLGSGDRYAANGYPAANGQYQSSDRYAVAGQYQASGQYQTSGEYQATAQYPASGSAQYASAGRHAAGDGQYSRGQYSSGNYGSGQYLELGSGSQPAGGGRHAQTTGGYAQASGYGRTGGYGQGGQSGEPDQDTDTETRTPRFEPAEWDSTASRAGRY